MVVIVCYDIKTDSDGGATRLRKVAQRCERYGTRVQASVFELEISPAELSSLRIDLDGIIKRDVDSVRIYRLGKNAKGKITVLGRANRIEIGDSLIL